MKYVSSTLLTKPAEEPVEPVEKSKKKNIKNKSIELAKRINLELRVIKLGTSHTLGSKAANQSSTKKFVFLRKTERKDKNKVNSPLGAIFGIDI